MITITLLMRATRMEIMLILSVLLAKNLVTLDLSGNGDYIGAVNVPRVIA